MYSVFKELISFNETNDRCMPVIQHHFITTVHKGCSDEQLFIIKSEHVKKEGTTTLNPNEFYIHGTMSLEVKKVTSEVRRTIVKKTEEDIYRFYRDAIVGEILKVGEHFNVQVCPSSFAPTDCDALSCQLNVHANKIGNETRRACGNIFIISRNLFYTIIQKYNSGHNFDLTHPEQNDRICFVGMRYGGGRVYLDPHLESNTIIVGYNGGNTIDTGMAMNAFCTDDIKHSLIDTVTIDYHIAHNFKVGSYYKVMHLV